MSRDGAGPGAGLRALVRVSAALAGGREDARDRALDAAAEAVEQGELERGEVEEALLQAYLFLGFPPVLAAMEAWRQRVPEAAPEEDPLARAESVAAWTRRGRDVCRRVYGSAYRPLRRKVAGLHPALDRWMVAEGYGKVLGRPDLELGRREVCVAALLAVRGWEPQLHSHLRGALNAGMSRAEVEGALETALPLAPDDATRRSAREVWRSVLRRRDRDAG